MKKLILSTIGAVVFFFSLAGCVERRYVHTYNHHSPEWYGHRHRTPPPEVDISIHRGR